MDSITQAALGAAVGEASLGKKVGYRAALWGAVVGTIPDLDVAAYPLMDEIARLSWHRGYSHSILFSIALAPILAWVIKKIHGRQATWREWTILTFLVLITHIFLDCFTVYGTQLFLPFSNHMVGFNSIAIIDPIYTIPLLGGVILTLFFRRYPQRRIFNYLGLIISSVYLIFTLAVKYHVSSSAGLALKSQDIDYNRLMTTPTLFNSFLWRITAEVDEGYHIGYFSILDNDDMINFRFVARNESLIKSVKHEKALQGLLWFSNGYYVVSKSCDVNLFHDLRFGEIQTDFDLPGQYIFTWKLIERGNGPQKRIELQRADFEVEDSGEAFLALWSRIKGT